MSAIDIGRIERGDVEDGYAPVRLHTAGGPIDCRLYEVANASRAVIWVGGVGGGWDTPARDLYPRLARELVGDGVASLRVRYRHSTLLEEAVFDVLVAGHYLETEGIAALGLVGHSFGGAVVIRAATALRSARTVVPLSAQGYGAEVAGELAPACSVLLVHGTADRVLSHRNVHFVHGLAHEPKRLVLYEGAGHGLDEVGDELRELVHGWLVQELRDA